MYESHNGGRATRHFIGVDYVLQISVDQERAGYRLSPLSGRVKGGRSQNDSAEEDDDMDEIKVRLEKLDRARHMLKPQEYENKRKAILDGL